MEDTNKLTAGKEQTTIQLPSNSESGLTFARFPDGKIKVFTVRRDELCNNFARGQVVYAINDMSVQGVGNAKGLTSQEMNRMMRGGVASIRITVGPKPAEPAEWPKKYVDDLAPFVGEFKGIDQFLEGIQGQIGLPFGNIERGMELELASDDQEFSASNNEGRGFKPSAEYAFVTSDHVSKEISSKVPGCIRDREEKPQQPGKPRHFVPLKIFLYAACAKPLQSRRQCAGTEVKDYRGKIPQDLEEFVFTVLLRRAREAVLTRDALKDVGTDRPGLKGLAEVANGERGNELLTELREAINEAFCQVNNETENKTYGLPKFTVVAEKVVEEWNKKLADMVEKWTTEGKKLAGMVEKWNKELADMGVEQTTEGKKLAGMVEKWNKELADMGVEQTTEGKKLAGMVEKWNKELADMGVEQTTEGKKLAGMVEKWKSELADMGVEQTTEGKSGAQDTREGTRNAEPPKGSKGSTVDSVKELEKLKEKAEVTVECLKELVLLARERLKGAELTREEIIGLRIYTGPLFVKMNGALRKHLKGKGGDRQRDADSLSKRYANTIFAATSGLVKLSKVSPIPEGREVFRGLSGIELPESFWNNDMHGVKGGVEMAFLSTTTNMQVAIDYSNPGKDNMPFIFTIKVGAIDKGAALSFLSQFPEEDEILMPPRSFLEVTGTPERVVGPKMDPANKDEEKHFVWAIPVRINCNVQNFNIENFATQRKTLLLSTVDQAIMEVREELARKKTDTTYLKRARRADDLEFASRPQVQILVAEDGCEYTQQGRESSEKQESESTQKQGKLESRVQASEPESLPVFLRDKLRSFCPGPPEADEQTVPEVASGKDVARKESKPPRLIVLVITDKLNKNHAVARHCEKMKKRDVPVIAVLAPKYRTQDSDAWWPQSMGFLHNCKHVDFRDPDVASWKVECDEKLIPLVRQNALLSRGVPDEYLLDLIKEEVEETRQVFDSEDPAWFNDDFNFRLSMQEALSLLSCALAKLTLYIEEPSRNLRWIVNLRQRTCRRLLIGKQRRKLAELQTNRDVRESTSTALELCKITHAAKGHDGLEDLGGTGNTGQKLFTWTPLMFHAADGNTELVRLLLAGRAQVDRQDDEKGVTALRLAAEYGCTNTVQVLLEHKASPLRVDKTGSTAFLRASENGHLEVLKRLHEAEPAVLNRANDITYTPLMAAVKQCHTETVRWLLKQGAQVNRVTSDTEHTALIIAAESPHPGVEIVDLLLEHKADTRPENKRGLTALLAAIVKQDLARVKSLLASGVDPDEVTMSTAKKLQRSKSLGQFEVEKITRACSKDLKLFHELDKDGSGLLDKKELQNNQFPETQEFQDLCVGDGTISYADYKQMRKGLWETLLKQSDEHKEERDLLEEWVYFHGKEELARYVIDGDCDDDVDYLEHIMNLEQIVNALRDGSQRFQRDPQEWSVDEVKKLLRDLGASFAAAVEVVDKYQLDGQDISELVKIEGVEGNALYMPPEKGGLGLVDVQVRKLKRELARREQIRKTEKNEQQGGPHAVRAQ